VKTADVQYITIAVRSVKRRVALLAFDWAASASSSLKKVRRAYEGVARIIFALFEEEVLGWAAIRNFGRIRFRGSSGVAELTIILGVAFVANNWTAVAVSTNCESIRAECVAQLLNLSSASNGDFCRINFVVRAEKVAVNTFFTDEWAAVAACFCTVSIIDALSCACVFINRLNGQRATWSERCGVDRGAIAVFCFKAIIISSCNSSVAP